MTSLSCPLCSVSLTPATLESHLREELNFPHLRCRHCLLDFTSEDTAHEHFSGAFAKHPGMAPSLLRLNGDADKEARLEELARLARGAQREVEKRLCICGQCRLTCRDDGSRKQHETDEQYASQMDFYDWQQIDARESESYLDQQAHATVPERAQTPPFEEPPESDNESIPSTKLVRDELPEEMVAHGDSAVRETPCPSDTETLIQTGGMTVEPLEPENATSFNKPELKNFNAHSSQDAQLPSDGKVTCLKCGARVLKDWAKSHALGTHNSLRLFSCNHCPRMERSKGELKCHQRAQHDVQLSGSSYTFAGSETAVSHLVEQCFGAAVGRDWARLRCQPCDRMIRKLDLKSHIAVVHLQKALHACRLCGFTNRDLSAGATNRHVKKKHGEKPGRDTIDSSKANYYSLIIKSMIPQLFTQD